MTVVQMFQGLGPDNTDGKCQNHDRNQVLPVPKPELPASLILFISACYISTILYPQLQDSKSSDN